MHNYNENRYENLTQNFLLYVLLGCFSNPVFVSALIINEHHHVNSNTLDSCMPDKKYICVCLSVCMFTILIEDIKCSKMSNTSLCRKLNNSVHILSAAVRPRCSRSMVPVFIYFYVKTVYPLCKFTWFLAKI